MSSALAIETVTAVLKDLLNNGIIDGQLSGVVGEVRVSALPPDRVLIEGQAEASQLNLFLYQVTPNQGWRNVGLPSRDSNGERISNPPLALDLHYLLTAYGANEFHGEILLGYALQLLHETPVLTRDSVRRTLTPPGPGVGAGLPPALQALVTSELADQVEQVRITPLTMSVEEISKLWSAIQSHYRPTAAFQASVVLIESRRSARGALPVADDRRGIYVIPFRHPSIDAVVSSVGDLAPIAVGTTIEIRGRDLKGDPTVINLAGTEITPAPEVVSPERISVPLTAPLPAGIRAGINAVQVLHRIPMGDPLADHRGFESNTAAFVLRPAVLNGPVIPPADLVDVTASTTTVDGVQVQLRRGRLRLTFDPPVGRDQRVTLLLNEVSPPANARPKAYSFRGAPSNGLPDGVPEASDIEVPFANVVTGTYLVRAQVDGAESVLGQTAGVYDSPRVAFA
jgi:hypothetical protein